VPISDWRQILDVPAYPATGYARLADRIAALLRTNNDVLLVQGEAIIALEAVAASIASPQIYALNIVTSPYGKWFGEWLGRGGAQTVNLIAAPGLPVTVEATAEALRNHPETNLVALVHAESATGILNPLPEIAQLARTAGALLVADCVASVGGHALDVDALGIDVSVIGPQKALAGSSGVSATSVSERAWAQIDRPDAPRLSTLSLVDLRRQWLQAGRGVLPGMPSAMEFYALEAALDRVEDEGIDAVIARHALAAVATRDGVRALGLAPWVADVCASNLVTAVRVPDGANLADVLAHPASRAADFTAGVGETDRALVRLNHTGQRANRDVVLQTVRALAAALSEYDPAVVAKIDQATEAVLHRYRRPDTNNSNA
jgi:aspartate aminotransferase-like enzyme